MLSQGANQICINKKILKSLQRHPEVLIKYGKKYNELLYELKKIIDLQNNHDQISTCCL